MSTLAEIEAAIENLPACQVEELAEWLEKRRARQSPRLTIDAWLKEARGVAQTGVTTDELIQQTRGE